MMRADDISNFLNLVDVRAALHITLVLLLFNGPLYSQSSTLPVRLSAEVGTIISSSHQTPFWLKTNQFGSVPSSTPAGLLRLASTGKSPIDSLDKRWFVSYSVEAVGNLSRSSRLVLPEAYVSLGKGKLELIVGRRKEVLGLVDTTLSSGSYSWSGNALPIPKIHIGTRGFASLPFTNNLIAFNAFLAHGWFANTDSMRSSFLHQKALYGRIGKPDWPVKLYGGVLHHTQWGGRSEYLGKNYASGGALPSSFKDLLYVMVAQQPNGTTSRHDSLNVYGNHIGSIDVGVEIDFTNWNVLAYYQHAFEDKSGLALVNLPDGLYGLKIRRHSVKPTNWISINHILVECLTTMNQSGITREIGSRLYLGIDDYFNNFQYIDGWTHQHQVIGSAFLSRWQDVRKDLRNVSKGQTMAIANNRVQLIHFALAGLFSSSLQWQARLSFSHNYGLIRKPFGQANQLSGLVGLTWPVSSLGRGVEVRMLMAVDRGELLTNSIGGWLSLRKSW